MNNRAFASNSDIHKFATFWIYIFQNSTEEKDTISMQDQMVDLGFDMDCGNAFASAYGISALRSSEELQRVIDSITDVRILCSGIFSVYRGITHWTMTDVLFPQNRERFLIALSRLLQLTSN
jgi:hypothetical protein